MEKEKPAKSKNMILKFLPKTTSVVTFHNPPFSPGRDKLKSANAGGKGFSGPIISIIPAEARKKSKSGRSSFDVAQEPTSPKVSCIGQIKNKKKTKKISTTTTRSNRVSVAVSPLVSSSPRPAGDQVKKKQSTIHKIFHGTKPSRELLSEEEDDITPVQDRSVPSLSQMRRFASAREVFADFDWMSSVASDHRNYHSEKEKDDSDVEEEEEDDDDEVIIPHSAPVLVVGGRGLALEERKEINLWKRRTTTPPGSLQLNNYSL